MIFRLDISKSAHTRLGIYLIKVKNDIVVHSNEFCQDGLMTGDIIRKINDKKIRSVHRAASKIIVSGPNLMLDIERCSSSSALTTHLMTPLTHDRHEIFG